MFFHFNAYVGGSITGSFAAAVTTPLDVVKTRLMLGKDINGVAYNGFLDTFGRVYGNYINSYSSFYPCVIFIDTEFSF